jgi:hypothetical protein
MKLVTLLILRIFFSLFLFSSSAYSTDYSRLWRARSIPDNWLTGMQPQVDFLLGLMDRLSLERLEIERAYVYATGDQNLLMQTLDSFSPFGMRTSPHFSGRADRVYLMYYLNTIPATGSQNDYAIALHELCHGLFDAFIKKKLQESSIRLTTRQIERLHRKLAGFNEFFADQCAVYQSGNPRVITNALRTLAPSTHFMSRLNSALGAIFNKNSAEQIPAINIRNSVGSYPDISHIDQLASHFWFANSRRALWDKFSEMPEPTVSDRQLILQKLLSAGWRIFEFEAAQPNSQGLRLSHLRYDDWLMNDMKTWLLP